MVDSTPLPSGNAAGLPEGEPALRVSPAPAARPSWRAWLWKHKGIQAAEAALRQRGPLQSELLRRAALAFEAANHALEPSEPFAAGSGAPLALELYRQSLHWSHAAQHPEIPARDFKRLWGTAPPLRLVPPPDGSQRPFELGELLTSGCAFVEFAELRPEDQHAAALELKHAAKALLTELLAPESRLRALRAQRRLRLGLTAMALCGVLGAGLYTGAQRALIRPNLAEGKAWRISSMLAECHPEVPVCAGVATLILFHTRDEENPWFEYDLGSPTQVSGLTIQNRTDDAPDRAIPLIVELSNDRVTYNEVLRRLDPFSVWHPRFPAQSARYVRLRVPRRSALHLEHVAVHP